MTPYGAKKNKKIFKSEARFFLVMKLWFQRVQDSGSRASIYSKFCYSIHLLGSQGFEWQNLLEILVKRNENFQQLKG